MRRRGLMAVLVAAAFVAMAVSARAGDPEAAAASGPRSASPQGPSRAGRVREPAVAGLFYPKDEAQLSRMIDSLLKPGASGPIADLRALICPHAGYEYSGPTAGQAYQLLVGRAYQTVIVLAPSHYAAFAGASVCAADSFRTPLGVVPISEKAKALAKLPPFALETPCRVQRPGWSAASSHPAPAPGEDTPETWEHADEVQVPFLQKVLKNFKLVPIVFGEVDPEQAARVLATQLDDQTLIVVSSDLSHYHPYATAKELDQRCVQSICRLDVAAMNAQEACGKVPILTLMHIARLKGWKAHLIDYRNSGDTSGDKDRGVVGYAAIAFSGAGSDRLSEGEKKFLLGLARRTLRTVVSGQSRGTVAEAEVTPKLREPGACFVTLTKQGELRGCIGHLTAKEPLYQAVLSNAENAALRDYRFAPVQPAELDRIRIEISVLTEPQPLPFKSPEDLVGQLRPHQDGVVLRIGGHMATYLPQVWEQLPDKVAFLNSLSQKAGCPPAAWRGPEVSVSTYQVEAFQEAQ